ncbi:MAG: AP2 domain-containing protein [Anaerolineae bacterium]|nr:AP2 domain-containing protein [Anaerolineae bacterium]
MSDEPDGGFPTRNAVYAQTFIEEEKGRFVVYIEVGFWEPNEPDNIQTVRRRIQSYAKRRAAEIAAYWIERAAKKDLRQPPLGF